MAYLWQRWMPEEFEAAGLTVILVDGWENRGRPASTGNYDPRHGVTNHHDGALSSPTNPIPALKTLIAGRPDLPGPLIPWAVDHRGRVWIIAAGRCNHAGRVGKSVPFAAIGADGNALFMGDEVSTNGTQDLPPAQREAIAVTNAVYLKHFDLPAARVHRHADISGTGKWDLGSLTTTQLRRDATAARSHLEDDMFTPEDSQRLARVEKKLNLLFDRQRTRFARLVDKLDEIDGEKTNDAAQLRVRLREVRAELAALRQDLEDQ